MIQSSQLFQYFDKLPLKVVTLPTHVHYRQLMGERIRTILLTEQYQHHLYIYIYIYIYIYMSTSIIVVH